LEIEVIKSHLRDRPYMSGVERDKLRIKQTGEVFTPQWLAEQAVSKIEKYDPDAFLDPDRTFIDNAVGDGNLLAEVLIRKLENGIDFQTAISKIFGCDLMISNVNLCRERLRCNFEGYDDILQKNIIQASATEYDYLFGESETFGNGLFKIG
jgi:hypothetical protein